MGHGADDGSAGGGAGSERRRNSGEGQPRLGDPASRLIQGEVDERQQWGRQPTFAGTGASDKVAPIPDLPALTAQEHLHIHTYAGITGSECHRWFCFGPWSVRPGATFVAGANFAVSSLIIVGLRRTPAPGRFSAPRNARVRKAASFER